MCTRSSQQKAILKTTIEGLDVFLLIYCSNNMYRCLCVRPVRHCYSIRNDPESDPCVPCLRSLPLASIGTSTFDVSENCYCKTSPVSFHVFPVRSTSQHQRPVLLHLNFTQRLSKRDIVRLDVFPSCVSHTLSSFAKACPETQYDKRNVCPALCSHNRHLFLKVPGESRMCSLSCVLRNGRRGCIWDEPLSRLNPTQNMLQATACSSVLGLPSRDN